MTSSSQSPPPLELTPPLRASLKDGMAAAVSLGIGEAYLGVFGIFLKASTVQIGFLASLPQFIGSLFQLVSVWVTGFLRGRLRIVVTSATFNALIWFPIALIALWEAPATTRAATLIGFVIFYYASSGCAAPVWNSLIGDLVPAESRGRFFGRRNRDVGFFTFIALLGGGYLLDIFKGEGLEKIGFLLIFIGAGISRLVSVHYLRQYGDPPHVRARGDYFSLFQFIRRMPYSNFARFVFFFAMINGALAVAGPFFPIYMINVLHLSYLQFTVVTAVATIAQFLTMQYWGRLTDAFGTKRILDVCGFGVALNPLFWLIASETWHLFLIQAFAGFVWAGFNLASTNFIFDAVTPPKRARCAAYMAVINATFVLIGSLIGGYAASHLPTELWMFGMHLSVNSPILWVITLSGLLRLVAAIIFLPRFQEVRKVQQIGHRELLFRIVNLRPISGATFGIFTGNTASEKKDEPPREK